MKRKSRGQKQQPASTWSWTSTVGTILIAVIAVAWFVYEPGFEPLITAIPSILALFTFLGFKKIRRQKLLDRLIASLLVISTLIIVISQLVILNRTAFPVRENNEILIIIAPYDGQEDIKPEERIMSRLLDELRLVEGIGLVRVERFPEIISVKNSKTFLARIEKLYDPSIIIWGWYDKLGITTHYELARPQDSLFTSQLPPSSNEQVRLPSNPDSFVTYVTRELPQQMTYLSTLAIAIIYFSEKRYDAGHIYVCRAINSLPNGPEKYELRIFQNWAYVFGLAGDSGTGFEDDFYRVDPMEYYPKTSFGSYDTNC